MLHLRWLGIKYTQSILFLTFDFNYTYYEAHRHDLIFNINLELKFIQKCHDPIEIGKRTCCMFEHIPTMLLIVPLTFSTTVKYEMFLKCIFW